MTGALPRNGSYFILSLMHPTILFCSSAKCLISLYKSHLYIFTAFREAIFLKRNRCWIYFYLSSWFGFGSVCVDHLFYLVLCFYQSIIAVLCETVSLLLNSSLCQSISMPYLMKVIAEILIVASMWIAPT